jgi:intein-encoded DNA endonuclease-like protein
LHGRLLGAFDFTRVTKPGVKLRPTMEREKLYHLVLDLRKQGLSYNQIIRKIKDDQGITIRKSHISGWVNSKHKPFGYVRAFDPRPRSELAYVIGVVLGDGSTSSNRNHNHMIKLRVIDREFAAEFSRCLGVLLCRNPPPVKWRERTRSWYTGVSSLLLQRFLRQGLKDLVPTISHCDDCKGAFLRGFYDSEGSIKNRSLLLRNGELEKLELVRSLLWSLGIETTGPYLTREKGGMVSIKGHSYHVNKNQYSVYVRTKSLLVFRDRVGFIIRRKQERLETAVQSKSPLKRRNLS